jgi:two-component system, response regulator PdtaR
MAKRKILIVEDETMSAIALAEYLEGLGCEAMDLLSSGEEAVILAKAKKPDLVFMDVNLPGRLDGIAAAEQIARDGSVPIVFMSGYSSAQIASRAAAVEPLAFLVKPFDFSLIDGILDGLGRSADPE